MRCPRCRKLLCRHDGRLESFIEFRCPRCKAPVLLHDRRVTLQKEMLTQQVQ